MEVAYQARRLAVDFTSERSYRHHQIFTPSSHWKCPESRGGNTNPIRGYQPLSNLFGSGCQPYPQQSGLSAKRVGLRVGVFADKEKAGFGCMLRNSNGKWLFGCSGPDFGCNVLRSEIWAIWRGLCMARQQRCVAVECETDSLEAYYLLSSWRIPEEHPEKDLIQPAHI
ncbi:hypothetical protein PIB30_076357 [Stylosanthes scabra]|uniref:RNase H type-1 domain-containing protein n=1 Tax=Stylosanthes scabra TaxID=79078 RepID=A0ABU6QRE7_9FABA|nr:hypothetical protein [Stylosanthes scabra]